MVNPLALCLLAALTVAEDPAASAPASTDASPVVRSALEKGKFPWYDAKTDAARAIKPPAEASSSSNSSSSSSSRSSSKPPDSTPSGLLGELGNVIAMILFGIVLVAVLGLLVWIWRNFEPSGVDDVKMETARGEPSRIEALPAGMEQEFASSDPWEEAIRRRNRGDLAGAIICLFAHQLLTLSKLGLVRLAPGKTGRQLVKAVTDGELRVMVHPTLKLFEVVYYGHRSPTEAEFAVLWTGAEAFERRIAAGVAR